jgi:hypothetical protein
MDMKRHGRRSRGMTLHPLPTDDARDPSHAASFNSVWWNLNVCLKVAGATES